MIEIELMRAGTPDELGQEEECAICGERFALESVQAQVSLDGTLSTSHVCPACLGMLGRRNPERFPTLEEYEAAKLRLPRPMFASDEEALAAEETAEDHYQVTVAARRIERAGAR